MVAARVCAAAVLTAVCAWPQPDEQSYRVYTEHPRLLLPARRLRMLRRERERQSMRWVQFETLVRGGAPMPEPGFAWALYYQVSGDAEVGRKAVAWAAGAPRDLREIALVFDWCQGLLTPAEAKELSGRLAAGIAQPPRGLDVATARSRLFAAIALAGHQPNSSETELARLVREWWQGSIVPAIRAGHDPFARTDHYPLLEFLHALRDNLEVELRDTAPKYFKNLPVDHLVGFYPATYPAPEGEFRIPATTKPGEPDIRQAALARAAGLSMVAYDTNAPENQFLQGWLLNDHFLMRGTFGAPYEFLWANPYQPGLSYFHMPLVWHDAAFGRLFARSDWDETATWLGYFDGQLQIFKDGKVTALDPRLTAGPLAVTRAVVYFGKNARKFQVLLKPDDQVFVLGLEPRHNYDIEVDDEELAEGETDPGGILAIQLPHEVNVGVRIRPRP